ncbi:CocE/NonD family hydrolase [Actinoalloteichus hymeniacidonis]|uniref:Hydrolase, CocE/NonD family n=1 Tax=Actinoalloteichus hymeniacidonis TaxID=340345 RepID=A0AAC9HTF7_9PSEU|nr:CocE/NonD family hydrolase [Actinoalloteichus hymeniacidonis]AOS65019.1 putative hydrolase, CocE/NonD family [Actinoalloteichus hymeniacidonis]MBB5906902.1 hypothetical protein [Actinoalloteichus hymeniacidonis]
MKKRIIFPLAGTAAAAAVAITAATLIAPASADVENAAVATSDKPVTHDQNDRVPEGASWTQHYFPSSDGSDVELHADVLLPADLPEGEQVPVILSAGAYFGHAGQLGVEDWAHTGPSDRFHDFIEGTDLFDEGYAFVMVDTRGFGGSTGCLDTSGPGDQADVKAAIDWAAEQPWSTGAVGMYGKSWDAITGLLGNNLKQDNLKAVVAQEPIWDLQRNIRSNGVPRTTVVNVFNTYNGIATMPQMEDDDPRYLENAKWEESNPECIVEQMFGYQNADPESEYWKARDYAANAKGTDTPLLFTQGFLEWNTEPEAMQEFLTNHEGPQRGWLGQWDHVRGNDTVEDGRLAMGREGWFDETMSFYDQYLKDIEPSVEYPNFAVQDSNGTWRAEETWPAVDNSATIALEGGSYTDDGAEAGVTEENAFTTWSEPLEQDTRVTGTPRISLDVEGHGTTQIKMYDVAPDGTAVMFDEQAALLKAGSNSFELKSTDWTIPAGHSLAVEVGTIQPGGDWLKTPSHETITIHGAELELAVNDPAGDDGLPGEPAPYLETYLAAYTSERPIGTPSFTVPSPQG